MTLFIRLERICRAGIQNSTSISIYINRSSIIEFYKRLLVYKRVENANWDSPVRLLYYVSTLDSGSTVSVLWCQSSQWPTSPCSANGGITGSIKCISMRLTWRLFLQLMYYVKTTRNQSGHITDITGIQPLMMQWLSMRYNFTWEWQIPTNSIQKPLVIFTILLGTNICITSPHCRTILPNVEEQSVTSRAE